MKVSIQLDLSDYDQYKEHLRIAKSRDILLAFKDIINKAQTKDRYDLVEGLTEAEVLEILDRHYINLDELLT